jgi:hypothetical protein
LDRSAFGSVLERLPATTTSRPTHGFLTLWDKKEKKFLGAENTEIFGRKENAGWTTQRRGLDALMKQILLLEFFVLTWRVLLNTFLRIFASWFFSGQVSFLRDQATRLLAYGGFGRRVCCRSLLFARDGENISCIRWSEFNQKFHVRLSIECWLKKAKDKFRKLLSIWWWEGRCVGIWIWMDGGYVSGPKEFERITGELPKNTKSADQ